ncbi:hypothetical protein KP509_21G014500 [Ceratopteris richardii]|uniref:Uncharacterized protein n=1 Tax=Ceratopteris richardii TaxID=49495 RepID=A0A8T2S9K8_CERRI|nr:hypothetical protein KP509_21G014500 [Ceratopteris richardii]
MDQDSAAAALVRTTAETLLPATQMVPSTRATAPAFLGIVPRYSNAMAAIHPSAAPSLSSSFFTSTRTSRAKNAAATPSMATARLPLIIAAAAVILETQLALPRCQTIASTIRPPLLLLLFHIALCIFFHEFASCFSLYLVW